MLGNVSGLELDSFTYSDRDAIDPWFDDDDTRRFIGGSGWVEHSLLHPPKPPTEHDGRQISARFMWVAREDGVPVGVVDIETYDDRTADLALIVAPDHRRAGLCKRILEAAIGHPALGDVQVMRLGVEPDNIGAARCAESAGFSVEPHHLDEQGLTHYIRAIGTVAAS
jgi:Acetyltransferases, including N-acetylases of ribosomal proteins